jgi:hypothetical protein
MRIIRIIIGLVCVFMAIWLGQMAAGLFIHVVWPKLTAGPNVHLHQTVIIAGHDLQGWQIYGVPSALALLALGLVGGGVFMIFSRSHDAA